MYRTRVATLCAVVTAGLLQILGVSKSLELTSLDKVITLRLLSLTGLILWNQEANHYS